MTHDSPPSEHDQLRATVLRIRQLEDALRAAGVEIPAWSPAAKNAECICIRFSDTGGYRIADLTCPVHGLDGTEPGDGYWDAPPAETDDERRARFAPGNDATWGAGNWIECAACPDHYGRPSFHHRSAHDDDGLSVGVVAGNHPRGFSKQVSGSHRMRFPGAPGVGTAAGAPTDPEQVQLRFDVTVHGGTDVLDLGERLCALLQAHDEIVSTDFYEVIPIPQEQESHDV